MQCGIGRTGKLFAHEWAEVTPDVMAIAKGIGGGFPLGAVMTTKAVGTVMQPGTHGSTYGGNPLACAVGNAVLQEVESDGFLKQVQDRRFISASIWRGCSMKTVIFLPMCAAVADDRHEMCAANSDVVAALRDEKLLTVGAGDNVLRILPPLNVTQDEIDVAAKH